MRKDSKKRNIPILPDNNISALPKDIMSPDQADRTAADPDTAAEMEYGEMNPKDAKESGYIDEKGKAVSKARKDLPGSPTGALTDIGAGRSSVVHHHDGQKKNQRH